MTFPWPRITQIHNLSIQHWIGDSCGLSATVRGN